MSTDVESQQGRELVDNDFKRCNTLINACVKDNQAHGQFLTGIRVNFDLTCSNKMWVEAERYRFLEFVSSCSTMHRITKFDLDKAYNKYVDERVIDIMKEKVDTYNTQLEIKKNMINNDASTESIKQQEDWLKELYLEILYTNPAGFTLTARMTTNYRCLRNIYKQRKNHRLKEWQDFCHWIETLPYAKELLIN